jgi:hypothetical protein
MKMFTQTLIQKILLKIVQIVFTLALTIVLGYCVLNLEPVRGFFRSEWGSGTYKWVLNSMGSNDLADMLGTFTLIWLSMTPSLAVWICVLLTQYLRRRLSIHPYAQP